MQDSLRTGDQKGSKTAILQTLRLHGTMSRIELMRRTELSRATISLAISELIELNLVRETEVRQSTGGRPATSLELVPDSHIILGADLNDQMWILGAFDLLGNTVGRLQIPYSRPLPEAAVQALTEATPKFIQHLDKSVLPVIGLGVPGLVDTHHGLIRSSAVLSWQNVELGEMIERNLGRHTVVLNRSRARGLSECRYGAGKEYDHMIYIGVDTGIGAGIYVNRELIHGAIGGAGEIGHTTVDADGPLCPCGNKGCLQMLAASPAIEQETRRLLRQGERSALLGQPDRDIQLLKFPEVGAAADQGDPLALRVIEQAAAYLGVAMANLVNLLNPQAIILGGPVPKGCNSYVQAAVKVMRQRSMNLLSAATSIRIGTFDEIGGSLGAANYALDRHLSFSHLLPAQGK